MELSGSPFGIFMFRKRNVWFSVNDGNWSDAGTWVSNALDKNIVTQPRAGDSVVINHNVTLDAGATQSIAIDSLSGSGSLIYGPNKNLIINKNLNMIGNINMTAANANLTILGIYSYLGSLTNGTTCTITYDCPYAGQYIMPLTYRNLTVGGSGLNLPGGDISVLSSFSIGTQTRNLGTIFDLLGTNFSVSGNTIINGPGGILRKSVSAGTTLFTGLFNLNGSTTNVDFSGNQDVEFRGGITNTGGVSNWGTGIMKFTTTAAQNFRFTSQFAPVTIQVGSGVTLSNISTSVFYIAGSIDGVDGTSVFNNDGQVLLLTSTLPMAGNGVFNYKHSTGTTMGFMDAGSYTLPYSSFENLIVAGNTGSTPSIKTLLASTTIAQTLQIGSAFANPNNGCTLECATFDLTVNGATSIQNGIAPSSLSKTGSGNILFVGLLTCTGGASNHFALSGNPTVECRGGMTYAGNDTASSTGSGWKFTTNNQTVLGGGTWGNILISGAITITNTGNWNMGGVLNGDNASSTLKNNGTIGFINATAPMATGVLDCSTTVGNNCNYSGTNQDIKGGTYKNLLLQGGGTKKLLGNVSVINTYTLAGGTTLNSNGFALTNP